MQSALPLLMAALLLRTIVSPAENHNSMTCYGDARDGYFSKQFTSHGSDQTDSELPFPADKCRLAREMLEEIQYLRTLMDKCERCPVGTMNLVDGGRCKDKPCLSETSCVDTGSGAICGPCPVGFDSDGGVNCVPRAAKCH
ncbi:thrombospondin-4-like [Toxorhynchites rutilus septentrionalis]|uniref:thrombospondin-4-like n=1 Tax=Toxorhynchites rutilus septentrionalis TaxID=329112 RepID=UPI0024798ADF|nr:thrombospondin-4-like [Toxorhynchites rutilus septentrionalis]